MTKIVHIVLCKFKPDVSEEAKAIVLDEVLALKDKIPVIKSCTAGKTFTERSKGYEYAWVVELEKKEDLPLYANAEPHLDFVSKNKPLFEDLIAVDYEN